MTAAKKSRPAQLADEIEALGWTVERAKDGARRTIRAQHGSGEVLIVEFERRSVGFGTKDVFVSGEHFHSGGERSELRGLPDAVKVAKRRPFALDAPDDVVLAALAGKTITWTSRITNKPQNGVVPRGGVHLKISGTPDTAPEDRVLHFTDPLGFHAVRIGAITAVK